MKLPEKLQLKLQKRIDQNALRKLPQTSLKVDFSSNDYLGFAQSKQIFKQAHQYLLDHNLTFNGSTGSRLLTGNHNLYQLTEQTLIKAHEAPAALIFNSGYDANLGLLSSICSRKDIILYDQLAHASIRDGIQLSKAKSFSFKHNDLGHLQQKLQKHSGKTNNDEIYVVTESVFSMDGDSPDLIAMQKLCEQFGARLIVDEAHAIGVFGYGLVQEYHLQQQIFARVITFGKGMGCHGAAVLGCESLIKYLVNFSRAFIYTTALSPHSLSTLIIAYQHLKKHCETPSQDKLSDNISHFKKNYKSLDLEHVFIDSDSAIQSCIISENKRVKSLACRLQKHHFDVKAILAPTVPTGQERLRFCLHSFNSYNEIEEVLLLLKQNL